MRGSETYALGDGNKYIPVVYTVDCCLGEDQLIPLVP